MADSEFLNRVREETGKEVQEFKQKAEELKTIKVSMAFLKKRIKSSNDLLQSMGETGVEFTKEK